jgi:hypothetical protein
MNVNVYLEDTLAHQLGRYAKSIHKPRNMIIREAVKEWLAHHEMKKWPKSILNFKGYPDFPAFESLRSDLHPSKEDPLA